MLSGFASIIDSRWRGRRVAAAMSGGVDSSVAAVLLAAAGCDVVGITMKLWDYEAVGGDRARDGRCCTVESFADCRAIAAKFDFPHYTVDLSRRFAETVMADFVSEYRRGRTPNPCAVCNTQIKWPALWEKAVAYGCDAIATGHYARLEQCAGGDIALHRGIDATRDQSYFLWGVPREFLTRTIFPLGRLTKIQVREIARRHGLVNAERPESRDICFVTDNDLDRFLAECADRDGVASTPGPVLNAQGIAIGRHDGFERLTIGQRKGLGIATGRPQYITAIDAETGAVTIGDDADLFCHRCLVTRVNWLMEPPKETFRARVQIRYRHQAAPALVIPDGPESFEIVFDAPQRAITPGQSAVVYDPDSDRLLGGGVIASVR
ncbi:MAG: tRNA 2-thiouridine(34) synthase MnmA [Candidatus Zixiibacteriota bacterium]